jgi:hypothetical protein
MAAIQTLSPAAHFDIFTHAPEWLFRASLNRSSYHPDERYWSGAKLAFGDLKPQSSG